MTVKKIRRSLGILAVLAAGSSVASASTLIYYIDVFGGGSATTTFIDPSTATLQPGGSSAVISIPKLVQNSDPNPGFIYALSAVNLSLNWISAGSVQVTNLSCFLSSCQSIPFLNASSVVPMTVVAGGTTVVAPGITGPISGTANAGFDPATFINTFPGVTGSGSAANGAANIGLFEGIGAGNVSAAVSNGLQTYGGSAAAGFPADLAFGGNSQTGGVLQVTYTFAETAVPEPVTTSAVGGALIGLAALARSRRAKRG